MTALLGAIFFAALLAGPLGWLSDQIDKWRRNRAQR